VAPECDPGAVHLRILKAAPCNRRCLIVVTARDDADPFLTGDPKMLVSHGAMILVIDGAKMSLLRNRGKDFAVDLELVEHGAKQAASTTEMGTDKPGRSFASVGRTRSAYQATDYHQAEEDDFAKAATEKLNDLAQQSNLDFIVIAAPHVLGVMRHHYSPHLRNRLIAEINKDYAGRPTADVAELLRNHEL
jgi:protein required for attachment to host cells